MALLSIFGFMDHSPGLIHWRTESRNLDCERLGAETGSRRYPGEINPPGPRGDFLDRVTVVCKERLVRPGLRSARDEAILSSLEATTFELAESAVSLRPDLAGSTWLVEAYYPSGPVAAKIAFATKNVLVGRGLIVSDRTPILGAGDIDVITRMEPEQAYPAACLRYLQTGSLGEGDALLALVNLDPRETILHVGLCANGQWTWLR